jgi:ribosomal protein S18 acetylase RimI-like enzyme
MSNTTPSAPPAGFTIRHELRPGDLGAIIQLHGTTYAREYGFDATFEAYVAEPLAVLVRTQSRRDRLWIAERESRLVGCIAIVGVSDKEAQLRWFLVDPAARGTGLGKHLIREAVAHCRETGYESVFLWTVGALETAAHLYRSFGFRKVEANPGRLWGVDVVEEKYVLNLMAPTIRVQPADPGSAAAIAFLADLDEYQAGLYPAESNHLLPIEALRQPNVTFLIAEVDGQPAGCGAFVHHGDYAEIKRMFVAHGFRGLKIGRRILDELEARIRAAGLLLARLETGVSQPEALGLYERAGYQRRGPFGSYGEDPLSVFMEKKLA